MSGNTVIAHGPEKPQRVSGGASYRVPQVDHTVAEPSMVQQLEVESNALGQRRLAAAHEHRAQEQHALVDQPVPERLSPDGRAANAQVRPGSVLEPSYRLGIEAPLDSRPRRRHGV